MHHFFLIMVDSSKCGDAAKRHRDTTLKQAYNILIDSLNVLQKERPPE
jgi:hypothetical protein